ncbi:MAG: hypothetical protein ACFFD1_11865, partial [Candidatus Thorarchaeota archaeon]
ISANQGIIRVLPTQPEHSYKLIIYIKELKDDFIDNVVEVLSQCRAKLLYSSGVCFADEMDCFYEAYIENPEELKKEDPEIVEIKDIVSELSHIDGVIKVESSII